MVLDFAGGPLAVVLQFGLAAEHAVLGRFQVLPQFSKRFSCSRRGVPLAERFGRFPAVRAGRSRGR